MLEAHAGGAREIDMGEAMKMRRATRSAAAAFIIMFVAGASAQTSAPPPVGAEAGDRRQRHPPDRLPQARPVAAAQRAQRAIGEGGFDKAFPPPGVEVVSWYVEMGIGQVITLRLPASRLREVNRVLEDNAWAPIGPSSIRPTITRRSAWPSTRRRNKEAASPIEPHAWPASEPYRAWRARISMIANRASAMTANDTPVVAVPSA